MVYINVPLGFNSGYTVATKGTNSVQGLSFHVSANIIDKKKFKWLTRGSFLFPKTISDDIAKYDSLNTYRSQMNFSWQNQISYKQFFAQTNFLADVNHKYYTLNANGYNYSSANKTDFWLSNILIGYNFKMASVYVQSRNLILSQSIKDNYQPYQYFGIGANFKL